MIAPRSSASPAPQFGSHVESLESRTLFSTFAPVFVPDDLSATPLSSAAIKLTWTDDAVNELRYVIFRSTDNVTFEEVINTVPGAESWVDNTVAPGTKYFYKLRAVALTASSAFSNLTNATSLTVVEDVFAKLNDATDTITVNGTSSNDIITVTASGANTIVTRNSVPQTFATADVKRITILGISGADQISVGASVTAKMYISGGGGNDTITGNAGDDRLDGGAGNDVIHGGDGNDTLTGGDGNDSIFGDAGNDYIRGGNGKDRLAGGDGNDTIFGDLGSDRLFGDEGIDSLVGGGGSNSVLQD
jgi:Ca2+-binding RTX toxin-like protein